MVQHAGGRPSAPSRVHATIERFAATSDDLFRRNLIAARERGERSADTEVDGLAKVLTALDMGLMTHGVVAPGPTDSAQVSALLDGTAPHRGNDARIGPLEAKTAALALLRGGTRLP